MFRIVDERLKKEYEQKIKAKIQSLNQAFKFSYTNANNNKISVPMIPQSNSGGKSYNHFQENMNTNKNLNLSGQFQGVHQGELGGDYLSNSYYQPPSVTNNYYNGLLNKENFYLNTNFINKNNQNIQNYNLTCSNSKKNSVFSNFSNSPLNHDAISLKSFNINIEK